MLGPCLSRAAVRAPLSTVCLRSTPSLLAARAFSSSRPTAAAPGPTVEQKAQRAITISERLAKTVTKAIQREDSTRSHQTATENVLYKDVRQALQNARRIGKEASEALQPPVEKNKARSRRAEPSKPIDSVPASGFARPPRRQDAEGGTTRRSTAVVVEEPVGVNRGDWRVGRTPSNNLAVYHLRKRGGNKLITEIKKIEGDVYSLRDELAAKFEWPVENVTVRPVPRSLHVKGHHKDVIMQYFAAQGF